MIDANVEKESREETPKETNGSEVLNMHLFGMLRAKQLLHGFLRSH